MDTKVNSSEMKSYFIHESSIVDEDCELGIGTKIWHFSHSLKNTRTDNNVNIEQNFVIGLDVTVGNNVKIQNNVYVYSGVTLEDKVFCNPYCVFTNVINPRKHKILPTLVREEVNIGANATIIYGITIWKQAFFIETRSVVTKDILDYQLVYGNTAQYQGWMCECGNQLDENKKCKPCGKTLTVS
jgi:UDP-2-acetamido-3-amino-2,3-dideoxy-glucuronate N-acetyltransferase